MKPPKCRTCGEHHWGGVCPAAKAAVEKVRGGQVKDLPKSIRARRKAAPAAAAVSPPQEQAERFEGDSYGRSPASEALPMLAAWNALPEAARVAAARAFIEGRTLCPVCEARRVKDAERVKRWRERQAKGLGMKREA